MILSLMLGGMSLTASAQSEVRPYDQWEETAFVSIKSHQPADYVRPDNNWEILYTLRTPHTMKELNDMGVKCSRSQLMLLEIGGMIQKEGKKWHTVTPILDEEQTRELRAYSKQVADKIFAEAKPGFQSLMKEIDGMGFKDNTASLIFSYLMDGRMWTELTLFEDVNEYATWNGCYWLLYEPRKGSAFGTNAYGNMRFILTYGETSEIVPSHKLMEECAKEIEKYGKVTDERLIGIFRPYGVTDSEGNLLIPVIKRQDDNFHRLTDGLKTTISTGLKNNVGTLLADYGITNEKLGIVILYHEVMWDIMDLLKKELNLSAPTILTAPATTDKRELKNVTFIVEGGLFAD